MITFPNCKINLGLRIFRRRADGYHDIETVMVPVRGLCDALEILRSETAGCTFSSSGLEIDGPVEKNLCVKAYALMRECYGVGGVKMHLHKHIPFGAGLGGGSADAAFTLKMLNELFELSLSTGEIQALAAELGSDTAFFVENRPALATGRGEVLSPIALDLSGYHLYIVKPLFGVSTAEAYAGITLSESGEPLIDLLSGDIRTWKETLTNDFEATVFPRHPELAAIKQRLYERGALYAAMSGSGSAVFGIFEGEAEGIEFSDDYFVWHGEM
jgi:4-diphosphocytidyl-2-C-methyl-D-erythritol kinase